MRQLPTWTKRNAKRIHLFEFCDSRFCPWFLRDSIVEILGRSIRRGKIYTPAAEIFGDFCARNNYSSIIDLGSGTGEPISTLIETMEASGVQPPQFYLSDLLPNIQAMLVVADRHKTSVEVIKQPIDAVNIPKNIEHQARTIISAFHHFPPEIAQNILIDCVKDRKAIFIVEAFPRGIKYTLPIFYHGFIPWLANPFLTKHDRILKSIFTFLIPIVGSLGFWDGIISSLRMYTEDDLMEMVEPFSDFEWQFHVLPIHFGSAVTVFTGVPK